MSSFDCYINFEEFEDFKIIAQSNYTKIATSTKISTPTRKYIFKIFQYECNFTKDQKIFLDTFYQISNKKNQYIQSYKHLSLIYDSNLTPTFSMKYISSKTLEQFLRTPELLTNMTIENVMHCLFAVAEGMSYLHSHLIYHGNLCPSNIIIDDVSQFYLIDFGLYPIKKLYMNIEDIFNNDYKDPHMRNNQPSFINDVYSYGILICDIFISFLKTKNLIEKEETLKSFLQKTNKNKFDIFPPFFVELIASCLNSFSTERPSFNHIISKFKTSNDEFYGIKVQNLYNEFINSNYFLNLASTNDPIALNKVGKMYEKGELVERNYLKALEFYEKAANLKYSKAQNNYGVLLQKISGDNESELIKGARYLQMSAEQGDVNGMANYGVALLKGIGVPKNFPKAGEYLQKSADLGSSFAEVNYGFMLLDNNPIFLGVSEGLRYIKKAMNHKNPDAYYAFGVLLQEGKFIEKNDLLAMEYFKIAADMGHEKSIKELTWHNSKETSNTINDPTETSNVINDPKEASNGTNDAKEASDVINDSTETSNVINYPKEASNKPIEPDSNNGEIEKFTPIKITSKITLVSLGQIVYDRTNYHTENYIYPVGYQVKKKYFSIDDPNQMTTYLATVLDGGESPIFRVESLEDKQKVFEGSTPTSPWSDILQSVENTRKQLNIPNDGNNSISGPASFGFLTTKVRYLIERLPNATKCVNYRFRTLSQQEESEETNEEEIGNDQQEAPTVKATKEKEEEEAINHSSDGVNLYISTEDLIIQGDEFANKKEFNKASKCYNELLKRGITSVLLKCADISQTFEEKLEFFEQAIQEKIPTAFSKLRALIQEQISLTKEKENLLKYAKLYEKYQDYSDACIVYNQMNDKENSMKCFEKAKQNIEDINDGYQQYDFAIFMIDQNEKELAKTMLEKASKNDVQQAQVKLNELMKTKKQNTIDSILQEGINYFRGINGKEKSTEKSMLFFEKASKLGCPKADFYIGFCNINDYGVDHLKKSADAGDPDGQNRYAYYLEKGILMKENKEEAMKYYKLAADQGHAEAMFEYGKELYENESNDKLKKEGIKYLKKSADKMFPAAVSMYSKICKDRDLRY